MVRFSYIIQKGLPKHMFGQPFLNYILINFYPKMRKSSNLQIMNNKVATF